MSDFQLLTTVTQDRFTSSSSAWTRNGDSGNVFSPSTTYSPFSSSSSPAEEAMKGNGFGDRARQLTEWFQAWNACEQTIALYSLLSKVSAVQARFLSLVLEHSLKNGCDSKELTRLEKQANDAGFLNSLHKQTEEQALALLLTHLPLLHLGNSDARKEYMKLLPKVLLSSSKTQRYFDQCRQLLSLALVHPAFPPEDKKALNFWLEKLDGKHKPDAVAPTQQPPVAVVVVPSPRKIVSLPPSSTPSIASATPPSSSSSSSTASPHKKVHQIRSEESSSGLGNDDLLIDGYIGPVSNGFESDAPTLTSLSPQPPSFHSSPNYVTPLEDMDKRVTLPPNLTAHDVLQMGKMLNSRSTTLPARTVGFGPADDMTAIDWNHGMKDVPTWLKSLRLHKYAPLFAPLTYEDMLDMTEEYLEKNHVTQGARKKIVLSICRLVKRPETLLEIEQDMEKHGRLLNCIQELRQMLLTPIKPYTKPEGCEEETENVSRRRRDTRREERLLTKGGNTSEAVLSGDEEGGNEDSSGEEGSGSPGQHSSSDPGSDLDELLTRDFPTDDLPSLISRAMGKAYSQLMMHTDTNEDNLTAFIKLLDSALQHEAFTLEQKKLFFEWKQQCHQVLRVITPRKPRSNRTWGAFTIAGMPLNRGSRGPTRSLRQVRNGGGLMKTMPVPTSARNSSTLPRVSPRTTGPALPANTFRPSSTVYPAPSPSSGPSQMNAQSAPFVPNSMSHLSFSHHPPHSSSSSAISFSHPHKPCDQTSFDHLAEDVAEFILNDPSES